MENLDLLLVNPSGKKRIYGDLSSSLSGIEPPLWMGLIAAFIRDKGFSVKIIDAEAEDLSLEGTVQKIIEFSPKLVGIGVMGSNPSASSTPKMVEARGVINILKEKNPKVKIGLYGIHPSALPEKTLREERVDFIFRGEVF